LCGNPRCQPIVTSGHFPPDYIAPSSTCDELPQTTIDQCGLHPTCACLEPLLQAFDVWPPSRWNCAWFCTAAVDGGVDLLRCSLP
jgi:hypothetical protein